jgi:membrane-bound serine protease (ClpP class)
LLFLLGLALLGIEVFLPGFGIFGIGGIVSLLASFFLVLGGTATAVIWLAVSIIAAALFFVLLLRHLPSSRLWSSLILKNTSSRQAGFSAGPDYEERLGQEGVAMTPLRPGGVVEIGGEKFDVLTQGEFVQPGQLVAIVKVEGNKIFVRPK